MASMYVPGSLGSGTYAVDDMIQGLSSYRPPFMAPTTPAMPTSVVDAATNGVNLFAGQTPATASSLAAGYGALTPQVTDTPSLWGQFQNWMKDSGMLGTVDAQGNKTQGWGGLALGAAQGLGNAFLGMQQYNLAKDAFEESKRQFGMNWEAQRKTTNAALEDRQRARIASNPGAYQSVGDYMGKYGV